MSAVFVSDLHLVSPDDEKTQLFVRFLQNVQATHVFLVGDIFDLWVADHDYFARKFSNVVESVRALVARGIEVHYFEGNHDLHLEKFWTETGARVHADAETFVLEGQRVRVEHGDLINPEDKGYLFLRGFLRSRVMTWFAHHLPARAVQVIGERASHASRDYTSNAKSRPVDAIRTLIRAHAERMAKQDQFYLIVSGHVHVADDFTFKVGERSVRSVNLGSWFEKTPRAFFLDGSGGRFIDVNEFGSIRA